MQKVVVLLFSGFLLIFSNLSIAQSSYSIDTFTIQYDTLTDYNSIIVENYNSEFYVGWFERDYDLGFDFPFFDAEYSTAFFNSDGLVAIGDGGWYSLYVYDADWRICGEPESLSYSSIDYRYKRDIEGDLRVFKMEWHDVAICIYDDNDHSERYNFQLWLWENGDIDMIAGKMPLDTTIFKEGEGFFYTDSYKICGAAIVKPDDTYGISYGGNYRVPDILEGEPETILVNVFKSLPHEGFVVRFKRQTTSTEDTKPTFTLPSLVRDELLIPYSFEFESYQMHDLNGTILGVGSDHDVSVSHLTPGMYILSFKRHDGVYNHKFVKQ
ncbi:MAG: T9SS type A sorting domain-containing protein [Chitinophagales bacterium]|nr:T9SS type A sorting domain-containing protein [Chitinophagales bacterium]